MWHSHACSLQEWTSVTRSCSQAWSPGSWPAGTCISTPERPTMQGSDSLVAAVDLSLITSELWQRSWPPREASSQLAQTNMAAGVLVWRCTPSPGSEPGQEQLLCKITQRAQILTHLELLVLSVMSFHAFLSYAELVVTTGRPWSQPLVGPCAPPCLLQIPGVSQRVTRSWCSRKRQPQRINLSSCLTAQRATKSALLQTMQHSPPRVWTGTVRWFAHCSYQP